MYIFRGYLSENITTAAPKLSCIGVIYCITFEFRKGEQNKYMDELKEDSTKSCKNVMSPG